MQNPTRPPLRRAARLLAGVAAVSTALAALYSCSLIVDTQSQQCQMDSDCSAFAGSHCDTAEGVCVGRTSTGSGGAGTCGVDGGIDGGGCYACTPGDDSEYLNECTGATCIPFDNTRVTLLGPGGTLPQLPTPDGG